MRRQMALQLPLLALTATASLAASPAAQPPASCPDYAEYSKTKHPPYSSGPLQLGYMRPEPQCRTFNSSDVGDILKDMEGAIANPDLYRFFHNAYPNTLDTAIRWHGVAADNPDEELTFVITGDIDAMWLRDSANQMQSYLPVLKPSDSKDSIASLFRGVINLQARYLLASPYCNSFQAPAESAIPPAVNGAAKQDAVKPPYDNATVFECKYELDSLAAFLQVSSQYLDATADEGFFARFAWARAARAVLDTARAMTRPTYGEDGRVLENPYTFTRDTTRATETLANDGAGSPVANGTGLVRSAFRPSDDSTIFQLLVPSNMMFSYYLRKAAGIATAVGEAALAGEMTSLAEQIRDGIARHAVVRKGGPDGPKVFAFEVDGFGSAVVMDDANVPSLLAAPFWEFDKGDFAEIYANTRRAVLDEDGPDGNPYFMRGPVLSAVGGPHVGPGKGWPMASVVRILTSDDDGEITGVLGEVLRSTDGIGLMHESVDAFNASIWTRQW
ncbi:uncharacterized protein E0L32_008736 [Thyridium curvatum]|uniref:Uncharacterized protein n=1 Tax=Thyridium curvatum TaxID=1093900 RepID=A0A507AZQ0_9PEZI|nr:uncharacterized protein E0L32_008736 [Thyridium curvatum]TPX10331.1 hypothetical protein E0L32_008736 [Thyridium curvatum]